MIIYSENNYDKQQTDLWSIEVDDATDETDAEEMRCCLCCLFGDEESIVILFNNLGFFSSFLDKKNFCL